MFFVVDVPVLLAQPPNSSSAATLGAGLKPPPDPGTMGVLAKADAEFPHPISFDGRGAAGLLGGGGAAGSGVAHSLLPHTSAPDIPADENPDWVVAVFPVAPVDVDEL